MKRPFRRALALLALLAAATSSLSGCESWSFSNHLTIAGSTAFAPVVDRLAHAFEQRNPGVRIDVHSLGSMVGIKSTRDGACDIGIADLVELPPSAASLTAVPVSRDGIAVVVHPSNPVRNLTVRQVADVFTGKVVNWKDLGGPDQPITVVAREKGSGTRSAFEKSVKVKISETVQTQNSNGACRTAVASDPNAISPVSLVLVDSSVRALQIEGVDATIENVRNGSYRIAATDFMLTKGEPQGRAKAFIEFALSAEGQKLIAEAGLVPIR